MTNTVLNALHFAPARAVARSTAPGFWSRLLRALETMGQRRAAGELRRIALSRRASDPELAEYLLAADLPLAGKPRCVVCYGNARTTSPTRIAPPSSTRAVMPPWPRIAA